MKLLICFFNFTLFFLSFSVSTYAQNEWIDYEQIYYKIKVAEDKVYRIPYETLQTVGLPSDATGFHLYRMGEEVPIYTSSQTLETGDFIEFYGQKNDGSFDTQLYEVPAHQPHPYFSLFTDTIAYFLTWDNSFEGERFEMVENDLIDLPEVEASFSTTVRRELQQGFFSGEPNVIMLWHTYLQVWNPHRIYPTTFGKNEGFFSSIINGQETRNYNLPISQSMIATDSLQLEVRIVGRSNDFYYDEGDQHVRIRINDVLLEDFIFEGYDTYDLNITIAKSILTDSTNTINIENVGDIFDFNYTTTSIGKVSLAYIDLSYNRLFDFDNLEIYPFQVSNQEEKYIEVNNFNANSTAILLDLSNHQRMEVALQELQYLIHLQEGNSMEVNRDLVLFNPESEATISLIENLQAFTFTDYTAVENQGNYLLITHPKLKEPYEGIDQVTAYADYRRSEIGGGHEVVEINVEELYDQFAYGIAKHSMSIQNFINFSLNSWEIAPKQVLLLGKGLRYNYFTKDPKDFADCLIPTFGTPGSDFFFTCPSPRILDFQLPIGRVSVNTATELNAYFQKVQAYEASFVEAKCLTDKPPHFKDILQVQGAFSGAQLDKFNDSFENLVAILDTSIWKPTYTLITNENLTLSYNPEISEVINEGVSFISSYGQSNGQYLQHFADPNSLMNQGKYPIFYSIASFLSDVYQPTSFGYEEEIFSERLVKMPNAGLIACIGNVQFGVDHYYGFLDHNSQNFFRNLSTDQYGESLGEILRTTLNQTYQEMPDSINNMVEHINLNGDPALRFMQYQNPDFTIVEGELYDLLNTELVTETDENVLLSLGLRNTTRLLEEQLNYQVIRTLPDGTQMTVLEDSLLTGTEPETTFNIFVPVKPYVAGVNVFEVILDPNQSIVEECEENNRWLEEVIYEVPNGLSDIANQKVKILPNPVQDWLNIESVDIIKYIELSDAQGKVVLQKTVNNTELRLNVEHFNSGQYYLKVFSKNGSTYLEKIVKQ